MAFCVLGLTGCPCHSHYKNILTLKKINLPASHSQLPSHRPPVPLSPPQSPSHSPKPHLLHPRQVVHSNKGDQRGAL